MPPNGWGLLACSAVVRASLRLCTHRNVFHLLVFFIKLNRGSWTIWELQGPRSWVLTQGRVANRVLVPHPPAEMDFGVSLWQLSRKLWEPPRRMTSTPPSFTMPAATPFATYSVRFLLLFPFQLTILYTAENLIPHSLDFVIGTRVAVAYQSEVEQISIIYDWKDLSFWSDDDEFRFMALFLFVFADKASWADALLRINNRFRAANPRRRVLWHYSGFYAIDLAACCLRIKF